MQQERSHPIFIRVSWASFIGIEGKKKRSKQSLCVCIYLPSIKSFTIDAPDIFNRHRQLFLSINSNYIPCLLFPAALDNRIDSLLVRAKIDPEINWKRVGKWWFLPSQYAERNNERSDIRWSTGDANVSRRRSIVFHRVSERLNL